MLNKRDFKADPFLRAVAKHVAVEAREKAIIEGLEKGMEKGLEKGMEKGLEKGMEHGRAVSVLEVLKARRMKVSEVQKKRILKTTDRKTLTRWLRLAATADSTSALFAH